MDIRNLNINQRCAIKLKFLREAKNYTQGYVAKNLALSQNAYSLIEAGTTKMTLDKLEKVSIFFDIAPELLINDQSIDLFNPSANKSNLPPALSSFEKKMYESTINRMEKDIERLYALLNQLMAKSANANFESKLMTNPNE